MLTHLKVSKDRVIHLGRGTPSLSPPVIHPGSHKSSHTHTPEKVFKPDFIDATAPPAQKREGLV